MKRYIAFAAIAVLFLCAAAYGADQTGEQKTQAPAESVTTAPPESEQNAAPEPTRKDKLYALLTELKVKSANAQPEKHEVSLPVASAGARGSQTRSVNRFAVLWPVGSISPMTALANNIDAAYGKDKSFPELKRQLITFVESFPEFQDERLLKALHKLAEQPE